MPIPKPNPSEKQDDYIARFMSNETMKKEYPDEKQRLAVAYSTWRKMHGGKKPSEKLQLNYSVPIIEYNSNPLNQEFVIEGIAINSTVTTNNHRFIPEELQKAAHTLNDVPLLKDHENKIDSIVGRVRTSEFDSINSNIKFGAIVNDPIAKQLIQRGDLKTVSVGAIVENIEEEEGILIPKNITFKELSLVAVPADAGATFSIALKEAYNSIKEETEMEHGEDMKKCPECGKMISKDKMKDHMEKHEEEKANLEQSNSHSENNYTIERRSKMEKETIEPSLNEKFEAQAKLLSDLMAKFQESETKLKEAENKISEIQKVKETKLEEKPIDKVVEAELEEEEFKSQNKNYRIITCGKQGSLSLTVVRNGKH